MKEQEGKRDRGGEGQGLLRVQISTQLKCKSSKQASAAVTPAFEGNKEEDRPTFSPHLSFLLSSYYESLEYPAPPSHPSLHPILSSNQI